MNGNPQTENGYTQIAHELLEALYKAMASGLITSRERAVIDYIIRYTYGYHQTNGYFHTKTIADELNFSMSWVSQILKSLENKKIINRDKSNIQFNKHYLEWSKQLKSLEPSKQINVKSLEPSKQINVKSLEPSKQINVKSLEPSKCCLEPSKLSPQVKQDIVKPIDTPKDITLKIKEYKDSAIHLQTQEIFTLWNKQKIIEHRVFAKFESCINGALKNYTTEEIKQAISNYATVLHDEQYLWTYKWTLDQFLTRKNALDRFCQSNFRLQDFQVKDNVKKKEKGGFYDVTGNAVQ